MRPKKYPYRENLSLFWHQKPFQSVTNAKYGVFIDEKRINNVEEEGINVQDLGGGLHRVQIDIITDNYKTK